jgi:hypothetical protein
MSKFQQIKELLHGKLEVYENFDYKKCENTLSPGSMPANEIISNFVKSLKPTLILEVGSWLGWSAWGMAKQMKENGTDGVIVCIDTWMGGVENWASAINQTPDNKLNRVNGYPTLYYNFLANMCYAGVQDVVIPFAYPSTVAANILSPLFQTNNVVVDMIYLDGSHLAQDVFHDCINYWSILRKNGILLGDDWQADGVKYGVDEFCKSEQIPKPQMVGNGVHWFMMKL